MKVRQHPITGHKTYYLTPPKTLTNAFTTNQRIIIAHTPQVFIDAYREKKDIEFLPGKIFSAERPAPSNDLFLGHGIPLIMPALKDAFLMQIAKKSQEAILLDHILPIRFAYPADTMNLARQVSMDELTGYIREQLKAQRYDQNRFIVFPFAVGVAEFGARGRALLMMPELREMAYSIMAACGFPQEFLFGGVSWSGSNVSLRMLENEFMFVHEMNNELLQFVADGIGEFMGWPKVTATLKRFKMADDLQRAAFDAQLVDRKFLSVTSLLQELDKDPILERNQIKEEIAEYGKLVEASQVAQAQAASAAMAVQMRSQAKVQAEMQAMQMAQQQQAQQQQMQQQQMQQMPPEAAQQASPEEEQYGQGSAFSEAASPPGVESPTQMGTLDLDTVAYAQRIVDLLQHMPKDKQQEALAALKMEQPGVAGIVMDMLTGQQPFEMSESFMNPLPEQRPPRRGNSPI